MMNDDYIDVEQVLGAELDPTTFMYNDRDVILYALGVGAAKDPLDPQELAFTYEGGAFKTLPTFAVTFPAGMSLRLVTLPGLKFNPMMLLHGEHYLEVMKPLPTAARVTSHGSISQVYDKGKGALILVDVTSKDEAGETLAFNQSSLFIRGIGGFGGDRGPSTSQVNLPPERDPDVAHEEAIPANQALLYRLAGDRNPLHADPEMAALGGYDRPILHGLCTFGFAARAVLKHFANNDPDRFKSIKARFARHFFPGETLITEMWDAGDDAVIFRCKVAERNEFVLTNAKIELKGI
jgi:3-hydroxyacyl-CoA dehydrogenase/3a,7a,12a-trihydroxy-5b-cholest-24-enoyl-CoA hydratase